jgi:hypothetical protein
MTSPARSTRTLEDRVRFGLGYDTQDDESDPSDSQTQLTLEGVLEAASSVGLDAADVSIADAGSYTTETTAEAALQELYTYKPLYSTLTANSAARNATTTLLASGLTVTVPVAGTYNLEALVSVTTAAAADVSLKFGGTATVTATVGTSDIYYLAGPMAGSDGTIATQGKLLPTSWTTEVETMFANTGASADQPFLFKGTLVVTAVGTIIISFTQGTSDATDTKIQAGSYLKLQRVA